MNVADVSVVKTVIKDNMDSMLAYIADTCQTSFQLDMNLSKRRKKRSHDGDI